MDSTSLFYNILSSSALKPFELLLRLAITSFLLHHLSTQEFGWIMTTISILGGIGAFCSLGLDKVVTVQLHRETNLQAKRFLIRKAIIFRFLMSLALGSLVILFLSFNNPTLLLWPGFILFLSEGMAGICSAIIIAHFKLGYISFLRVLLMAMQLGAIYFCFKLSLSWEYYLATFFILPFGLFLCLFYQLVKSFKILKREPLIYNPPLQNLPSSYMMEISDYLLGKQSDTVLLGSYLSATSAAVFATAQQLFQTLSNILLHGFNQASLGLYSKFGTESDEKPKALYRLNIQMEHIAVTIPMLVFSPLLKPFMQLYGGDKYQVAVPVLLLLILCSLPSKILGGGTNTTVLLANQHFNFVLFNRSILGLVNVVLNIILLLIFPRIEAVVLGTTVIGVVLGLIEYIKIRKLGYKNPFKSSFIIILISIIPPIIAFTIGLNSVLDFAIYIAASLIFLSATFYIIKPFEKLNLKINSIFFRIYEYIAK